MMARWLLTNGNGYNIYPSTEQELLDGLAEIDQRARQEARPRVAVLTADADADDAPYLTIALGAEDSVLVYEAGDDTTGGYSQGNRTGDTTEITYAYGTGTAEYQSWMLIPADAARQAAAEFFHTGQQPTNIVWGDL
jgi:hypothetical protein